MLCCSWIFALKKKQATGALLLALESDAERAPFMPLVQPTLAALSAALQGGHEGEAQEVLTALVDVAQNAVDFFRADPVSRFVFPSGEGRRGTVW